VEQLRRCSSIEDRAKAIFPETWSLVIILFGAAFIFLWCFVLEEIAVSSRRIASSEIINDDFPAVFLVFVS